MQHARAQVRGPQGQQFLVGVEFVAAGREGARGEDDVGVADQEHTECRQYQLRQVARRRQAGARQPGRYRADDGDAVVLESEDRDGRRAEHQGQQGPGTPGKNRATAKRNAIAATEKITVAGWASPRFLTKESS